MTAIHESQFLKPVVTPKGKGVVWYLIDYGPEADTLWTVVDDATGEIWMWRTNQIRAQQNISLARPNPETP